jgi:hypothetical protein
MTTRFGSVDDDGEQPTPEPGGAHHIVSRSFFVADVAPLDVDGVRTVAVGTILWLAAFFVLLAFRDRLEDAGRGWWLWTCVAGFGLGAIGWVYCRRRRRRALAALRANGAQGTGPADGAAR